MKVSNTIGRIMTSGKGRQKIGSFPNINDPAGERIPILVDKRGYDVRMGKPILHIPQFYHEETGAFSNIRGSGMLETTQLVESLRKQKNMWADVIGYSSSGVGNEDYPAGAYITIPSAGMNPVALKTSGIKAYTVPVDDLSVKLAGVSSKQNINFMTQEAKIPGRALMSAFGIMEPQVQQLFLKQFGGDKERSLATSKWLEEQYKQPDFSGIDLEQMADVFNTATSSMPASEYYSADMMFSSMFQRILQTRSPASARNIWKVFGIGLPVTQKMKTTTYSENEMLEFDRLLKEQPGLAGKVSFEKISGSDRYRLSQTVTAGSSVVLNVGASFTPEYQSQSGYINPKGIMSLAENFPEMSKLMGLTKIVELGGRDVSAFTGPNTIGEADSTRLIPSRKAWFDMWTWAGFQKDLNEFKPSIPAGTLEITPSLAGELQDAVAQASMGKTSEDRLNIFRNALRDITKNNPDFTPDIDLADKFMVDPGTGTLLPKLNSIMGVESYREGLREGETRTYIGDSYLRLVTAASQSAATESGTNYERVLQSRNRFFSRIANEFTGERGTRKRVYRNIYGVDLPGARGGRYMGLPGLDTVEAVADEDYIRSMLHSNNFMDPKSVTQVMEWMSKGNDAYLPTLVQRFPDVSGQSTWMPVKLRSAKWYRDHGGTLPENAGTRGVFYMSQTLNRFFVGDFDADPAMQKLIPITNSDWSNPADPSAKTFAWRVATPEAYKEFNAGIASYEKSGKALDRSLQAMFGAIGTAPVSDSLDAARKNLADYADAIQAGKGGSIGKRLGAVGVTGMRELMTAAMKVKQFKMGMGVAYNRRTLTEDIMDMVLTHGEGGAVDKGIREKAYESGAFAYQAYLDRSKTAQGDFNPLEVLFNTISLRGYHPATGDESVRYGIGFKLSDQGKEVVYGQPFDRDAERKATNWTDDLVWTGQKDPTYLLRAMTRRVSSDKNISNALLSWGFSNIGKAGDTFDMLEANKDPAGRAGVLRQALKEGNVGLNSPFYMAALYSLVRRVSEKNPMAFQDKNVKMPWINGEYLSLSEIAEKKEFKQADVLKKLFVEGNLLAGASEIEQLASSGETRLARHALGILREWNISSGGAARTDEATQALVNKMSNLPSLMQSRLMKGNPVIHASELGGMGWGVGTGWTEPRLDIATYTQYSNVMKWMGLPQVFGDRETTQTVFQRADYLHIGEDINSPTDIEKGNVFESRWAKQSSLHHIGQVKRDPNDYSMISKSNITFDVGGLTITGVPDFVDYDEQEGRVVIVDTKLAKSDPATNPAVRSRIASYKNRAQQVGYAYGLETLAKGNEDEWIGLMRRWGFDTSKDMDKITSMRRAASQGRFSIALQPGNAMGVSGAVQSFAAIPIEYNDEVKREYEGLAAHVRKTMFSAETVQKIAADVFGALMSEGGYPALLSGAGLARTGFNMPQSTYRGLEQFAKYSRAAFGGQFDRGGKQMIRVGEGGPEDIVFDEKGLTVLPANQSPEARAGRTHGNEGYMGYRAANGVVFSSGQFGGTGGQPPQQPPIPPVAPVPQNIPGNIPNSADLSDVIDKLTQAVESFKPVIRLDFGGSAKASDMSLGQKLMGGIAMSKEFLNRSVNLNEAISQNLRGAFERAGKTGLIQGVEGSGNLFMMAQTELEPEQYMPGLGQYVKESKSISRLGKGYEQLHKWWQTYGTSDRGQDIIAQMPQDIQQQLAGVQQVMEGSGQRRYDAEQAFATAGIVGQGGAYNPLMAPSKYTGVQPQAMQDFADSVAKLTESTEKLRDSQGNLVETNKNLHEVTKARLDTDMKESIVKQQAAAYRGGRFFDSQGNMVSAAQRAAISKPTDEEMAGLLQYQAETEKQAGLQGAQRRISGSGYGRGMSQLARSFLGGWGLMYVGTLARMGETEYAQGYQQFEQAEQARYGAAGAIFGPGVGMGTRTEQIYQSALARGGNIPYRQWRQMEGLIAGTGIGDITGAISKGVGMGALSLFAGNLLGEAGAQAAIPTMVSAGAGLTAAMPLIAGATAIGALAFDQYSYYRNPIDTATTVSAGRMRQNVLNQQGDTFGANLEMFGSWWKNLSTSGTTRPMGGWEGLGYTPGSKPGMYTPIASSSGVISGYIDPRTGNIVQANQVPEGMIGSINEGYFPTNKAIMPMGGWATNISPEMLSKYQITTPREETLAQAYQRISEDVLKSGTLKGIGTEQLPGIIGGIGALPQFEKYDEQIKYRVISMMGAAGQLGNQDLLQKMMAGYSMGLSYDRTSQAVGMLGGGITNVSGMTNITGQLAEKGYGEEQLTKLTAVSAFLQNLPDDLEKISKGTGNLVDRINDVGKQYENIVGTLKEQPVGRALYASQMAGALGIGTSGLNQQIRDILALPQNQNLTSQQQVALQASTTFAEQQQNYWIQTQAKMMGQGVTAATAGDLTRRLSPYGARGQAWASGLSAGSPLFWSSAAAQGVDLTRYNTQDAFGRLTTMNDLAVADIGLQGQITGLPLYSTSLRRGSISAEENATNIFGQNWMQNDPYFYRRGATSGGVVPGFEQFGEVGGSRWLQFTGSNITRDYRRATQAQQQRQLALTMAFTTGVGIGGYNPTNPQTGQSFGFNTGNWSVGVPGAGSFTSQGGGSWGIEDAQRALQNMQSQWGFGMAERQAAMQTSQFFENNALNRRGTLMQRGFTQQGWQFQDQTRQLQWGWRTEDFAESSRFLTGRERRLAERQMGRETIMYGLEGEQVDKQREQQKEAWKLEDEQYKLQIKHFNETKAFQDEANKMNRLFYEEQKRLIEESTKMQRAYWVEQQKLQQESIAASQKYSEQIADLNKTQELLSISSADANAQANLLTQALMDLNVVMQDIVKVLEEKGILGESGTTGTAGSTTTPTNEHNEGDEVVGDPKHYWHWNGSAWVKKKGMSGYAMGGHIFAGQSGNINDTAEEEFFSPDQSGTIIPLSNLNPWASTMIAPKSSSSSSKSVARISIFIGNKHLKDYIIDAIDQEIYL